MCIRDLNYILCIELPVIPSLSLKLQNKLRKTRSIIQDQLDIYISFLFYIMCTYIYIYWVVPVQDLAYNIHNTCLAKLPILLNCSGFDLN